jgi:glutamine amidotransferase
MCRLFGMSGGRNEVQATFWLVDAPDSLLLQSQTQPDGVGLGTFEPDGTPRLWRKPVAANRSETFVTGAHQAHSRTFLAHIRHATAEPPTLENTHPFEQHGRLFAHNGVLADLDRMRARLGEHAALLRGGTDSELYFTLITKRIEEYGGDVAAGIAAAANELADDQPLYSLNMVLTTPDDVWSLRYPDTNELWILERTLGSIGDLAADTGITRVFSGQLAILPATVIASQPMDQSPDWRMLEPGELIHVDRDLNVTSQVVVDQPPATLMELTTKEAVAQASPE